VVLASLHNHKYGRQAVQIGHVVGAGQGEVVAIENGRVTSIEPLIGAQLPRLC
jgi:hydrogenase maturation factor